MDSTVLVALITGIVTALSTLGATALATRRAAETERWRAEHTLEVERSRRRADRELQRDLDVRTRFDDARKAVLRLGMTVRLATHVRAVGPPRPGDEDLVDLLRQARSDGLDAVVAVERLRGVLPLAHRGRVDDLRETVDRAFTHVQTGAGQIADALAVQKELDVDLRAVEEALFPVGTPDGLSVPPPGGA